ncbi:MAG: murein biosynthesis integral membrane protein MurJ [Planctomycetes bacterium]|nr:murein biosynthesis integral membrane protein MurJ [Planctomycetota bacterium]
MNQPVAKPPHEHARGAGFGSKAAMVSGATMISRILALVREQLYAALFSASMVSDAYQVAFRIPNLLRDLFAEGALSAAFVPTFTDRLKNESREAAFRLANVVIGAVLLVVGLLTIVGIAIAPGIVHLLADDFAKTPGKFELTVELTRVMFPFLPFVSLAAVAMGQLNAQERFGLPALASATFNVVAIAAGVGLHFAKLDPRDAVLGWSVATVLGGLVQLLVQVPALRKTGFRFRPRIDLRDPGLRRIAMLMAPATVGLAATQLNIFVNTSFAAGVPGAVSWLNYAFRLMQLPIGVFGVAVATIAATRLAHAAAAKDTAGMSATLSHGLRLVAFLTVPCTIAFIFLAEPIARLLFEHGRFRPSDTVATAAALVPYATGLYCYSAVKVAAPAFYALGRTRVPLVASLSAVAANVALNFALFPIYGYPGLALGTALAATVNFAILVIAFHRTAARLDARPLASHLTRVLVASCVCGGAALAADRGVESLLGIERLIPRLVAVAAAILTGVVTYGLACRLLRIAELDEFNAMVRRRVRR